MTKVMEIYDILLEHFGPQDWWPGDSKFEIMVGAILTQQANWSNVERAIENLKDAGALNPAIISDMKMERLEELIRPSGFYRQKARYIQSFCRYIMRKYGGDLEKMFSGNINELRKELLVLPGIGPETCDSILLYAGETLTFVIDAYTVRISQHIGLSDSWKYDVLKCFFEEQVQPDVQVYNEFHALLVALGKGFCRTRNPLCRDCPLNGLCRYFKRKA